VKRLWAIVPLLLFALPARADVRVDDPERFHQDGLTYMREEKWNLAVEQLQKSIAAKADDFRVWIDLGDALVVDPRGVRYGSHDRNVKAAEAYRKAIDLNPSSARAWNNLAWMWAKSSDSSKSELDEALKAAERAKEIEPTKTGYLDTLAEVHYARKEYADAVGTIQEALDQSPDDEYLQKQLDRFRSAADAPPPTPTPKKKASSKTAKRTP
jgi:Flp pilus assembly protein TadD